MMYISWLFLHLVWPPLSLAAPLLGRLGVLAYPYALGSNLDLLVIIDVLEGVVQGHDAGLVQARLDLLVGSVGSAIKGEVVVSRLTHTYMKTSMQLHRDKNGESLAHGE